VKKLFIILYFLLYSPYYSQGDSIYNLLYYHPDVKIVTNEVNGQAPAGSTTYNTHIGNPFLQDSRFLNIEFRRNGIQNSFKVLSLKKGEKVRFMISNPLDHIFEAKTISKETQPKPISFDSKDILTISINQNIVENGMITSMKNSNLLTIEAKQDVFLTDLSLLPKQPSKQYPNIVFIVVDALRADVLGSYDANHNASTEIDKFAQESIVFKKHLVNSSWTRPSTMVFFTGLYPSKTYINFWDYPVFPNERESFYHSDIISLPAKLERLGYKTFLLGTNPFFTDHRYLGVDIGFSRVKEFSAIEEEDTKVTTQSWQLYFEDKRKEKQAVSDRPFFLFLNYNTPHGPYQPPQQYTSMLKNTEGLHRFHILYLGEVAFVDQELGKFFTYLKKNNLYDSSLILLTSDHGEVMNTAHRVSKFTDIVTLFGHGQGLYEEDIHVPFILKLPNQKVGKVIEATTRSIDIMPTILDIIGETTHVHTMDGLSMMNLVNSVETEERIYYGESRAVKAIRKNGYKLQKKTYEFHRTGYSWDGIIKDEPQYLFDIKNDPNEISPIENEAIRKQLDQEFENFFVQTSVYTIRANFKNTVTSKKIKYRITAKSGKVILTDFIGKQIVEDHHKRNYLNGFEYEFTRTDTEEKEIHFVVYPDIVHPNVTIEVDGKEVKRGEYGVGELDIYPENCKITEARCSSLFVLRTRPPDKSPNFRVQFWKKSAGLKTVTTNVLLEKESIDILKKQGYIK
jgi:arylsulfatase A-like enzyme